MDVLNQFKLMIYDWNINKVIEYYDKYGTKHVNPGTRVWHQWLVFLWYQMV